MKAKNKKDWHKKVCEKYDYVCVVCKKCFNYDCYFEGEVNQMVCGHHKQTVGAHKDLELEVEVGVCVCKACHANVHSGLRVVN